MNWRAAFVEILAERQDGLCGLCDWMLPAGWDDVQVDHIVPRARGGSDDVSNLQAVHARCNARKGARDSLPPPRSKSKPARRATRRSTVPGRGPGRPRTETGRRAYQLKAQGGRTWVSIAREVGLSDAGKGNVAKKAARRHAEREGLPWPVVP